MAVDFREYARDSLLDRLRETGVPDPEVNVDAGPGYMLDFVWRRPGITVLFGWPGREAHNELTVAGWRVIYLEPVEAWQVSAITIVRRALGLPVEPETD